MIFQNLNPKRWYNELYYFLWKYHWFDCNIINVFQRFEKQHCETSIASSNIPISKVSKNRTSKVPVSLVGSPCFNIGKICVSIHLFIKAKVLKMCNRETG